MVLHVLLAIGNTIQKSMKSS